VLSLRTLRLLGVAETVTLAVLLVNLLGPHTKAITSSVGPLHGTLFLAAIGVAWSIGLRRWWVTAIPAWGGIVAARARSEELGERRL
jgi:hypothetical protein